ncbi:HAD domain-containing protein [Brevibacterium sp. 50QC2O2]|uniref:HAD domain-containing protein n=1 Tax=Brevibacterium sp. 50QC2O2 TaxID=2968459 RepID=UPI00211BFA45|nr:HAD domain-containing protein [Brevibacterium sp. 50QC2O2]MCQ9389644.1 HAD domain-containing protein [Brevibacterium sp. 50QC2O2]
MGTGTTEDENRRPTAGSSARHAGDSERRAARHVTVFLDVDGVLNSFPVPPQRFRAEKRRAVFAWNYELHYRPRIVKMLDHLVDTQLADIVWLSTWSDRCRTEIEPALQFKHSYPAMTMPDQSYNRLANDPLSWWKARIVREWLDEHDHDRAVWVDDDLVAPGTREYFADRYGERLLMVAPPFATGLTEEHLALIRDFTYGRPRRVAPRTLEPAEPARRHRRVAHPGTLSGDNPSARDIALAQAARRRMDHPAAVPARGSGVARSAGAAQGSGAGVGAAEAAPGSTGRTPAARPAPAATNAQEPAEIPVPAQDAAEREPAQGWAPHGTSAAEQGRETEPDVTSAPEPKREPEQSTSQEELRLQGNPLLRRKRWHEEDRGVQDPGRVERETRR